MVIVSKYDENDIIECLDLLADKERRLKILAIMGWGAFNGFQYRCLEVDNDGNSIFTPEVYDDGDFDRQFVIYNVIRVKAKRPKPTDKMIKELGETIDGLDKLMAKVMSVDTDTDKKGKGGKRK